MQEVRRQSHHIRLSQCCCFKICFCAVSGFMTKSFAIKNVLASES